MQENDRKIVAHPAELLLLLDANTHVTFERLAGETGINAYELLNYYPKVGYFFATSVINELIRGPQGMTQELLALFKYSLQEEAASIDDKDNRMLYNHKDGTIHVAEMNTLSAADRGQILLCQNHPELILVTSDHKMLKTGMALLDRRIMDTQGMLEFFSDLSSNQDRAKLWRVLLDRYMHTSGYQRPKAVRILSDREPGKKHPYLP